MTAEPAHILVIDPDPWTQGLLERMLQAVGYQVTRTATFPLVPPSAPPVACIVINGTLLTQAPAPLITAVSAPGTAIPIIAIAAEGAPPPESLPVHAWLYPPFTIQVLYETLQQALPSTRAGS
jgi:hypothetical protein